MKLRQSVLVGAVAMLLAVGGVMAEGRGERPEHPEPGDRGRSPAHAPEIDAAAGAGAIALLSGVVLLMGEKKRARRLSRKDDNP